MSVEPRPDHVARADLWRALCHADRVHVTAATLDALVADARAELDHELRRWARR